MLRHPLLGFVLRFAVLYGIFLLPIPAWNDFYGDYFRALGTAIFSSGDGGRVVRFDAHELTHGFSHLGTRITLVNRDAAGAEGKPLFKTSELDTRSIGWVPTALTAALILASPIPWKRRLWALGGGMILIHLFILFSLQSWIWDESPAVSLVNYSPFWKARADDLEYTLMTQLGASFSVPLVIWILVTFRRRDLRLLDSSAS
jgi:hypothetical protein